MTWNQAAGVLNFSGMPKGYPPSVKCPFTSWKDNTVTVKNQFGLDCSVNFSASFALWIEILTTIVTTQSSGVTDPSSGMWPE